MLDSFPDVLSDKEVVHLSKGETVFYKGDVTTHAYFIIKGCLTIQNPHTNGEVYLISKLNEGAFMCDLEIISGKRINTTTLTASTDCILLKFKANTFLKALKNDNQFLFLVSQKMAEKMYQESYRLGDDLYKSGLDKLKLFLIKSFQESTNKSKITIHKNRDIISKEIGISIKTVNRSVTTLKKQEKINIQGGKIHLDEKQYQVLINDLS